MLTEEVVAVISRVKGVRVLIHASKDCRVIKEIVSRACRGRENACTGHECTNRGRDVTVLIETVRVLIEDVRVQ